MARHGSVLILAIWVMVALSLSVLAMTQSSLSYIHIYRNFNQQLEQSSHLRDGAELARKIIEEDPIAAEDSTNDDWYGENVYPLENTDATLVVHILDEDSKININYAPTALLESFFEKIVAQGLISSETAELALNSIQERLSLTNTLSFSLNKTNQAKRFTSMEEFWLGSGLKRQEFYTLLTYLTVYTNNVGKKVKININTASDLVLESIIASLPSFGFSKDTFLQALLRFLANARDGKHSFFSRSDLNSVQLLFRLGLDDSDINKSLASELLKWVSVNSSTFQVNLNLTATDRFPSSCRLILGDKSGSALLPFGSSTELSGVIRFQPLEILSWREAS